MEAALSLGDHGLVHGRPPRDGNLLKIIYGGIPDSPAAAYRRRSDAVLEFRLPMQQLSSSTSVWGRDGCGGRQWLFPAGCVAGRGAVVADAVAEWAPARAFAAT